MIRTASLRVYLDEASTPVRDLPEAPSLPGALVAAGVALTTERAGDDAYTAQWNGKIWRCPRTPKVRMLEGLLALRAASSQLGPPLFPQSAVEEARSELELLKQGTLGVSHILTSAWHVPIRWFVPFDPSAREVVDGPEPTIRYRQSVGDGLLRLDLAVEILCRADIPPAITDEVGELQSWLSDFPESSMVELDYGSAARFFSDGDLAMDESVGDLWASIEALADGDWEAAGTRYGALVERWAVPMAVAYSN